jgi:hypothetical protein
LSVIKNLGIGKIKGLDGPWVKLENLKIPKESFEKVRLDKNIQISEKYDLAISLEVAEHLPEQSSEMFIKSITNASDIVLFSAAIPFQPGENHINCQWPDYWNRLFKSYGYIAIDFIRRKIWHEQEIGFWYKQNILLYVKRDKMNLIKVNADDICIDYPLISLVHPDNYLMVININNTHILSSYEKIKMFIKSVIKLILKCLIRK